MISEGIPDVEACYGDGSHFIAKVICEKFDGLPLIKQHKMVYATLEKLCADIHACRFRRIPENHGKSSIVWVN